MRFPRCLFAPPLVGAAMLVTSRSGYLIVDLDREVKLTSLNGAPVLSQRSGKVVGALSRGGGTAEGSRLLVLTPASALREAMREAERFPPLEDAFSAEPDEGPEKGRRGRAAGSGGR